MNYIIIIAIVICLLIIVFSYFSSKHVNTIKENFSDPCREKPVPDCVPGCGDSESEIDCIDPVTGCQKRDLGDGSAICIHIDSPTPCYNISNDFCEQEDHCELKETVFPGGVVVQECRNKPVEKIESSCYNQDEVENCGNDTSCMTAPVYENPSCNFKENEKCSEKSLDDCNAKDGDSNRSNPGCRIEITESVSKCNGKNRSQCYNTDGCIFKFTHGAEKTGLLETASEDHTQEGVCVDLDSYLLDRNTSCQKLGGLDKNRSVTYEGKDSYDSGFTFDRVPIGETCNKLFRDNGPKLCEYTSHGAGNFGDELLYDALKEVTCEQNFYGNGDKDYRDNSYFDKINSRIEHEIDLHCRYNDDESESTETECLKKKACEFDETLGRCLSLDKKERIENDDFYTRVKSFCQSNTDLQNGCYGLCHSPVPSVDNYCKINNGIFNGDLNDPLSLDINIDEVDNICTDYRLGPISGYDDDKQEFIRDINKTVPIYDFLCEDDGEGAKLREELYTTNASDEKKTKVGENDSSFCFNAERDDADEFPIKCFPYTPENKGNFILDPRDKLYNLPNTFFKTEKSTLIALKYLKCEDINGIYQKAKEIIGSDDPSSFSNEQKTSANNIIKAVENGEIASVDGTKKCKILTGNCYNKCENLSRMNCATEQGESGECGLDGDRCKRTGCYEHSENQADCNSSPKCNFNAEVIGNYCIPKIQCGEGEELKISATDPSTGYNEFTCEPCQKGYYEDSNICKPCPLDTFSDSEGATSCTPKTTCNVDTQYVSSQVLPEIPQSKKYMEYDLVKSAKFIKDRYNTKKDRQCLDLTNCEKTDDKYVENKDYSITPYYKKLIIKKTNELRQFYNIPTEQTQVPCAAAAFETYDYNYCGDEDTKFEGCIKDDDKNMCREPEIPLLRYDDYSCKDLTTCDNETEYIGNYQEMLDKEFDSMFTMDRNCYNSSNCDKGYFDNDRVSPTYPIVTNKSGDEMYTQDRQCTTCQVDTYTDEPNMTKCIPQPTLGLGFGSVDYYSNDFDSKTKKMEYQSCLPDNLFQDTPAPHRNPCKTQQVYCDQNGEFFKYKEYDDDRIDCTSEEEPYPKAVCEVTSCVGVKEADSREIVGPSKMVG